MAQLRPTGRFELESILQGLIREQEMAKRGRLLTKPTMKKMWGGPAFIDKYGPGASPEQLKEAATQIAFGAMTAPAGGSNMVKALRTRYPKSGKWKWAFDDGKPYTGPKPKEVKTARSTKFVTEDGTKVHRAKVDTAEEAWLRKERIKATREIKKGDHEPFLFDEAKRTDVNPANYTPPTAKTLDVTPIQGRKATRTVDGVKQTYEPYAEAAAKAQDPKALASLLKNYKAGKKLPDADRWFYMKQMEDRFVKEFGPAEGRRRFGLEFADMMGATTGGASPTGNLLAAQYSNFQHAKGLPAAVPAGQSYKVPHLVGGRYIGANLKLADKLKAKGSIILTHPKRSDFGQNFRGVKGAGTIDEQISSNWGLTMPPKGHYGLYEAELGKIAKKVGTDPRNFEEIVWAGVKGGSSPMIRDLNMAIARTSKILKVPQEQVFREVFFKKTMPLFGVGGVAMALSDDDMLGVVKEAMGSNNTPFGGMPTKPSNVK